MNYLCVGDNEKCCIFSTKLSHKDLVALIKKYPNVSLPGSFDSTNWGGKDCVSRTLTVRDWELSEDVIEFSGDYYGSDYDHGSETSFRFSFSKLVRVVSKKELYVSKSQTQNIDEHNL
jgi:hypothetical protein